MINETSTKKIAQNFAKFHKIGWMSWISRNEISLTTGKDKKKDIFFRLGQNNLLAGPNSFQPKFPEVVPSIQK
jgi:hypothetical protein